MKRIAVALPISGLAPVELERRTSVMNALLPPGIAADIMASPSAPKFLDAQSDFGEAVDAAVEFFRQVDTSTYGVVVSAGALDPGLARARAACPLPVVGPGEAAMFLAAIQGRSLSVVTVDRYAVVATNEFLNDVAIKPPIASVRSMDLPVSQLVKDLDRGKERLRRECGLAVRDDGAEALYLGSMTLGTLGISDDLRRRFGMPVFDPMPIAMAIAAQCLIAQPTGDLGPDATSTQ